MAGVSAFAAYQEIPRKRKHKTRIDSAKKKGASQVSDVTHELKLNHTPNPAFIDKHKQSINKSKKGSCAIIKSNKNRTKEKIDKKHRKRLKPSVAKPRCNEDSDEKPPILIPIQNDDYKKNVEQEEAWKKNSQNFLNSVDPISECLTVFKMLISPHTVDQFLKNYWEKDTLHIKRIDPQYFNHILTTRELDEILRNYPLYFSRNVDVVSYENDVKEVHNPEGRVIPSVLWDFYSNGCSVRVLNPQTYSPKVHLILANLQEYFGTMVGANVYLTPPNSQGFAPHYDDIEAFIIQLEGRKHWKLYMPPESSVLARDSSGNFHRENLGRPFKEVTLNSGDLLYFPRGTIHEGKTDSDHHSLHITVSVYQHTAYADLLEHVLPQALQVAGQNDVNFRRGLPINYLKHLGHVNRAKQTNTRRQIQKNVEGLLSKLTKYIDLDLAADKLGRKFMHDCMPPVLTNEEASCSSRYDGDYMRSGKVYNRIEICLDTNVRLLRYHGLRLLLEEGSPKIYFCTDNAKFYHGEEEQWLELEESHIPIIEKLQESYPQFLRVEQLPGNETSKMALVADLWERGLLVTDVPLSAIDSDSDSRSSDL